MLAGDFGKFSPFYLIAETRLLLQSHTTRVEYCSGTGFEHSDVLLYMRMPPAEQLDEFPHEFELSKESTSSVTRDQPPTNQKDRIDNQKLKIAVLRLYDAETYDPEFVKLVMRNTNCYTKRHGYDLLLGNDLVDSTRPIAWTKFTAVLHYLDQYDYIFYIDMDAIFMNGDMKLEEIIAKAPSSDIIVTFDFEGINSGSFFVKRTEFSRWFFQTAWNMDHLVETKAYFQYEQRAIHYMFQVYPQVRDHIRIVRACAFNSRVEASFATERLYVTGDLVLHLCGMTHYEKHTFLLNALQRTSTWCPAVQVFSGAYLRRTAQVEIEI